MRRESAAERAAWTAWVDSVEGNGASVDPKKPKYGNKKTEFRGKKYASAWEAEYASRLWILADVGKIFDLQEQVRFELVPKNGKIRNIVWVADFTYTDEMGFAHYVDTKGYKTPIYRLKKKLAAYMLNISIEEVYKNPPK